MKCSCAPMRLRSFLFTLPLSFVCLFGCAGPSYEADKIPSKDAAKAIPAEPGTVLDVQSVAIEHDSKTAQTVAAGLGGILANQATKDSNSAVRAAATAVGATGGAIAVDMVASSALSPDGEEVIIELENGQTISVTQEIGGASLSPGDLVWVVRGSERTRVIRRAK